MSGLCGWFGPAGAERASSTGIAAMASVLNRFDGTRVSSAGDGRGRVAIAGRDGEISLHRQADLVAAVFGRATFTDRQLSEVALRDGIAGALARGYREAGSEVVKHLAGSFALAVLDFAAGRALLASDRTGTRSLCYATLEGTLVFGSSLDAISAFAAAPPRLNRQALYDYVHFHVVPSPQTIYADHHRLAAGSALVWQDGRARISRYWEMRFVEDARRPFDELKQEFMERLRASVSAAARDGVVGSFLSGGTDSSTVAGMLREVTGSPPRTYSIGFDSQGFDEAGYARIAARHFDTEHHEYYLRPADVVAAIPGIAAVHDQPFGNSSAVPTYYCARLAREGGVHTLLGGDGGDELFGGNARYATQHLYAIYSDLPRALRERVIEPAVLRMPAVSVCGKLQRYISTASRSMPERYDHYNLLERLGPENVFTSEFLQTVDRQGPKAQSACVYGETQAASLINRMLAFDLKYTLADNDLPKVTRSCELAGVEARFPLLDDAVVAFAASLPPALKLRGTTLRYFFKRALRGFLPPEVIAKKKHGFGMPFGSWLGSHRPLEELCFDSLDGLKKRAIVRPEFIDRLRSRYLAEHAEYFGTMVWVLVMLEQWFRQRRVAA